MRRKNNISFFGLEVKALIFTSILILPFHNIFAQASICDKIWRADYSNLELINIYYLKKVHPLSSMDLELKCDGSFTYTNLCTGLCWDGTWRLNEDQKSIDLISNQKSSFFPRTYILRNDKLSGNTKFGKQGFFEILRPSKE